MIRIKEYLDEKVSKTEKEEVLEDNNIRVGVEFEIESKINIRNSTIVNKLEIIVDDKINVYDKYHGGAQSKNWRIEPDSSISTYEGFELISPKDGLPLEKMLYIIEDVFKYIDDNKNLYTSDNTGFHVGISIKGIDLKNQLDYLKLALFIEEGKIFKYFKSRKDNTYTKSILRKIKTANKIPKPKKVKGSKIEREIINDLKELVPIDKYFGINFRKLEKNYIEFRYLGGRNYHRKYNKIRSQILDFCYFLKIAVDSNYKYKEYMLKLNRLIDDLEEEPENKDISQFVNKLVLKSGREINNPNFIKMYINKYIPWLNTFTVEEGRINIEYDSGYNEIVITGEESNLYNMTILKDGEWMNFIARDLKLENVKWSDGIAIDCLIKESKWNDGWAINSSIFSSKWYNGDFDSSKEDGFFKSTWLSGYFRGGMFDKSVWFGGEWEKGNWKKESEQYDYDRFISIFSMNRIYSQKFDVEVPSKIPPNRKFYEYEKNSQTVEKLIEKLGYNKEYIDDYLNAIEYPGYETIVDEDSLYDD